MNEATKEAIKNVDVKAYMKANNIQFPNRKKKFYGIKDKVSDTFCEIVENINDATMIRSLSMAVNQVESKTLISQRPEDFELWKLYEVDEVTGDIEQDKRKITNAVDYVNKQ